MSKKIVASAKLALNLVSAYVLFSRIRRDLRHLRSVDS